MFFRAIFLSLSIAAISACGGGGGSPAPAADTTQSSPAFTFYTTKDTRLLTTVGHAVNVENPATSVNAAVDSSSVPTDSSTSLSTYTLDNGVNSMSINTTSVSAGTWHIQTSGGRTAYIGGTEWNHSRFGYLSDKTSNSNGTNTEYKVRMMPFVRVNAYNTPVITSASYNKDGRAVGSYTTNGAQWSTITCDVSVQMTVASGAQTADLTTTNCKDAANAAITTTGFIRATKSSNANGFATATNGTTPFTALSNGGTETFTPSSFSIYYRLGGPNAEEMVGTVFMTGTTTAGANSYTSYVTLGFGASK